MAGRLKKLCESDVVEAIALYQGGLSLADVAREYGVTRQSMHDLLKRRIELRSNKRHAAENHFYRGGRVLGAARAQNLAQKAIARGALVPQPCEGCGLTGTMADGRNAVQAHHDDYNHPLRVRWLCQQHHHEWHRDNRPVPYRGGSEPAEERRIDVVCGGFP